MCYVAAYLLASLGGSNNPAETDIEKVLGSVGIEAESDQMKAVVSELKGKDLEALITAGQQKLASVPSAGVAVSAAAGGASAAPTKKEVKKEESEESDEDMGFGLFH